MISSKTNDTIKWFRRLQADRRFRQKEHRFVAEGTRWLNEISQWQIRPELILATTEWLDSEANRLLLGDLVQNVQPVTAQVMRHASTLESPPGVLMALPIPTQALPQDPTMILILDGVRNPGNLGTILRTAAAAGVDGVLLSPGCVDPYNPKVVRGGMGVQLRLPILPVGWEEITEYTADLEIYLATPSGAVLYTEVDWRSPSALIIGSEAAGVGQEARKLGAHELFIPMSSGTESLNAAVAAGIILFEMARQRA